MECTSAQEAKKRAEKQAQAISSHRPRHPHRHIRTVTPTTTAGPLAHSPIGWPDLLGAFPQTLDVVGAAVLVEDATETCEVWELVNNGCSELLTALQCII